MKKILTTINPLVRHGRVCSRFFMAMAVISLVVLQLASAPSAKAATVDYMGRMDFHSFQQGVLRGYDTWYSEGVVLQAPPGRVPQDVARQWMQWYVAHDRIIRQMNFTNFEQVYRRSATHLGLGPVKVLGFAQTCGLGCGNKQQAEINPGYLGDMLADPNNYYNNGHWTMLYEMSRGGQSQAYFNRGVWPINTLYEPALMVALFYNAFDNVGFRNGSAFEKMFDKAVDGLDAWETDPAQRSYLQEFTDPFNKKPGEWSSGLITNGILFRILQVTDSATIRRILENLTTKTEVTTAHGANNAMCDFQHAVNEATGYRYASVLVHRWRLPGNCGWNVPSLVGDGGIPGPAGGNNPPSISLIWDGADLRHTVGQSTTVPFRASDPDGDRLSFSASGMPPGLSINSGTGTITGTFTQAGTYNVTVNVDDNQGGRDSVGFRWIVGAAANRAPSISLTWGGQDLRGTVGQSTNAVTFRASDPDGDRLSFSASGMPPGLSINSGNGTITGSFTRAGTYNVTVSDGRGGTDSISFRWIVVSATNTPPTITSSQDGIEVRSVVGESVGTQFRASDPDGDRLTWSITGRPPGFGINIDTATIGGTLTEAGTYTITATVSDGRGGTDSISFRWIVDPVPVEEPPVVAFECEVSDGVLSWTDQGVARYFVRQIIGGAESFLTSVEGATSLSLPARADAYRVRARVDGTVIETEPCAGNPGDDPEPGGLPPLVIDSIDSAKYGYRYEGIEEQRESLERTFAATGTDLLLTVTGFDIDTNDEVRVLVNGTELGFLSRSPNNGTRTTQLAIPQSLLSSAGNILRFEQRTPGWVWGVTNLLLSESDGTGELPPLILDSVDSAKYGFRYDGINDQRESLERTFDASGTDVLLTVTGFDIDTNNEVRVLVNGIEAGFLSRTPNNGTRMTQLVIPQSLLIGTGNTLRFEQINPGWIWGVTDLLLSASDGGG